MLAVTLALVDGAARTKMDERRFERRAHGPGRLERHEHTLAVQGGEVLFGGVHVLWISQREHGARARRALLANEGSCLQQ